MVATRREQSEKDPILTLGRYALHGEIASGGMATVHFGRMSSLGGFSRTVAIKRMRRDIAMDPEFVAMFLDEARLTSRVEHPNVVATLDVVAEGGEVFLVMEYVKGESLSRLIRAGRHSKERVPMNIAVSIIAGALTGLHAAHEALGEGGAPLGIIHRDVSPQNILVGEDGITRITDFGIAKAESRLQITRDGMMKGKLCYMAPEQLSRAGRLLDRRVDIFACAVVAWELISGKKLFQADHPGETMANVLNAPVPPLTGIRDDVTVAVDRAIRKALARNPDQRWKTAEEFALALEEAMPNFGSNRVVGGWVQKIAGEVLANRHKYVREIESMGAPSGTPVSQIHPTPTDSEGAPQRAKSDYPSDIPVPTVPAAGSPPPGAPALAAPRVPRFDKKPAQQDDQPSVPSIGSAPIPGPRPAPLQQPISPRPEQLAPAQQPAPPTSQPLVPRPEANVPPQPVAPRPQVAAHEPRPISAPVPTPISSPVPSPISAPVPSPISAPVPSPISAPVPTPISAPVPTPISAPVPAPVPSPISAPVPAPIPSPVPQPPMEILAAVNPPQPAAPQGSFGDPGAQAQPIAPYAFDPSAALPAQPAVDARPPTYSSPAWTPPAQAGGPVDVGFNPQAAVPVGAMGADQTLESPPKLETRLFGSPQRTAAVYVGAILLLGLSLALAILAFTPAKPAETSVPATSATTTSTSSPTASAPATATEAPRASAAPTPPTPPSAPTAATADTAAATATADTPPANASASGKAAGKTKTNLVPVAPVTAKPPGKGTQTYIPDRP
ncbi:MAG: protein kinase [Deltaproteobacteria bacterium]|nr:protein kinase [Deltaproteobacteria bacterium]